MEYRDFDPARDREAVHRIWRETGWLDSRSENEAVVDLFIDNGRALVADVYGTAECLVLSTPGSIRYLSEDLSFSCITGVTTSRIARRQGLASRLAAHLVAQDAADGALVCGLGMFEQGFYNRLGFGTGSYEHLISFDPALLTVRDRVRPPKRITVVDWQDAHVCRMARRRGHGACNLNRPEFTWAEMRLTENGFGLGYTDDVGNLTHYFWCWAKDVERGPYTIEWMADQTPKQFRELLSLLYGLSDQVRLVRMHEPQGIQMQDLLDRPLRQHLITDKARFETGMQARAYWQMRICDLPGCLERTRLRGDSVCFNLQLLDPIAPLLGKRAPWHGAGGEYVVSLGPASGAEPGYDAALPTLTASVGAFTRLWLGVRPASGLAITDELA
ncbi:MAG TPA: GNAT family N-acetyltransferase, partial [Armatimonadota bacterium]|nr:GNAT family N-acetyltransferase [Armatimonadota bacterium]